MIGRAWYGVGNVDEEQSERQQRGHTDVDLLRRYAVEDGQKQRWRQDARQDNVHHVELVTATNCHRERDEREQFRRTAFEVELVTLYAGSHDLPFAVCLVAA